MTKKQKAAIAEVAENVQRTCFRLGDRLYGKVYDGLAPGVFEKNPNLALDIWDDYQKGDAVKLGLLKAKPSEGRAIGWVGTFEGKRYGNYLVLVDGVRASAASHLIKYQSASVLSRLIKPHCRRRTAI